MSAWPPAFFIVIFLGIYAPVCYWLGWNDPSLFDLRGNNYPARWAESLTVATTVSLFAIPLLWVYIGRAIDLLALNLALNALIIWGYFFLDITATKIFGAEKAVPSAPLALWSDS